MSTSITSTFTSERGVIDTTALSCLVHVACSHTAHHLLAIYSLGAGPNLIKAAFGTNAAYQRPAVPPPEPVNKGNWKEFLGDERCLS